MAEGYVFLVWIGGLKVFQKTSRFFVYGAPPKGFGLALGLSMALGHGFDPSLVGVRIAKLVSCWEPNKPSVSP